MTEIYSFSQAKSIIFLPFDLNVSNPDDTDPYARITTKVGLRNSLDTIFEPLKKVEEFREAIDKDSFVAAKKVIDTSKYHDFIVNNFAYNKGKGNENHNDIGFIHWFEKESKEIYYIDENEICIHKFGIVFNKLTVSGSIMIEIDWKGEGDKLGLLSNLEFFRYHDPEKSKKYLIKKDAGEQKKKTLSEVVIEHYGDISKKIFFNHVKPIVLHLIRDSSAFEKSAEELSVLIYKALRIPKKVLTIAAIPKKMNYNDIVNLKSPDGNIAFATMNEGVLVIDNGVDTLNSAVNKYLPAFVLALNQREFLLKVIRLVPSVDIKNINQLRGLNKFITKVYLEQISFTVSFYNEIDMFFKDLQQKFDIETLMKDNKESINEIHQLIELEEKEKQEKKQKNLNVILLVLTIIQAISFFYTLAYDKFRDSIDLFGGFMMINSLLLAAGVLFFLIPFVRKVFNTKD